MMILTICPNNSNYIKVWHYMASEDNVSIIEPHHEKTNNVVSEQARHKPSCASTKYGYKLEILNLESVFELYYPRSS